MIAKIKKAVSYFTAAEIILWAVSVLLIISSFFIFARREYLTLAASLVGVTALIFCAKGNPAGQALMILFSAMYGVISFTFAYYGEMMTYLGMSAPMAVFSLVSWLRNPYEGKRSEVKVSALGAAETVCIFVLSAVVTLVFYFILGALGTANLLPSTLSVTTSFLAVCLTFRRSPYYAAAYAANDVVLVILWVTASLSDASYVSVAGMLRGISCKRHLRIYKLVADEKASGTRRAAVRKKTGSVNFTDPVFFCKLCAVRADFIRSL